MLQDVGSARRLGFRLTLKDPTEELGFSEQAHQRANHHHRHCPPEGPLVDDLCPGDRYDGAGGANPGHDVTVPDHQRRKHHKVDCRAEQTARGHANAHQSAHADHRKVQRQPQSELADVRAQDRWNPKMQPGREVVVKCVEPLRPHPRLLETRPRVHSQNRELEQPHPAVPADEIDKSREPRGPPQQPRLEHALFRRPVIKRIKHDAGRASLRKGELVFVDEAALHRESEEHAEDSHHQHPGQHVPPGNDDSRDDHVRRQRRNERRGHVTSSRRNGLRAVVLEDREVLREPGLGQTAVEGEGENNRGETDARGDTGLAADVEIRRGEDAAQKETC